MYAIRSYYGGVDEAVDGETIAARPSGQYGTLGDVRGARHPRRAEDVLLQQRLVGMAPGQLEHAGEDGEAAGAGTASGGPGPVP